MKDRLKTLREKLDGHEIDGFLLVAELLVRQRQNRPPDAGTRGGLRFPS